MSIHVLHWSAGKTDNMELGPDGRVKWDGGDWHGAWYEVNGNLVITWDCRAQEDNVKTHFYRRIHGDVAGWELMERDGLTIPHKPQHPQRCLLLPKRVPPTSDENEIHIGAS